MQQPRLPTFNCLLDESDIDPASVLVMRHRPWEKALNLAFDTIATERPDLFNCYQSTHGPRAEAALKKAKYLASFVRHDPGTAVFIGLFQVDDFEVRNSEEIEARPLHQELVRLGMSGDFATRHNRQVVEFELKLTDWAADWTNRLIIEWPGSDRAWYQWGGRNEFQIRALADGPVIANNMPEWRELVLPWMMLNALPQTWVNALRHWRGIYLITDHSDGKQYVGSAYGAENLWQRWINYRETRHGGNKRLRERNAENFNFSILERVSPDAPLDEVIELETSWKRRIQTHWPQGLNEN